MSSKTRHQLLVDSRDRDPEAYPAPNRYRVTLPKRYRDVVSARLLSITVPYSFHVFTAAQRNTHVHVTVGSVGPKRVLVPDGNYHPAGLAHTLKVVLGDAFPDHTFQTGVDPQTMRLAIECEQGEALAVRVPPRADRSLAWLLGFRGGEDGSGGRIEASAVINTNPWAYVVLDIDELPIIDEGGLGGTAIGKGCFAHVPLPTTPFTSIFRQDTATPPVPQCPPIPRLDRLTVTFRTHDGLPVDFQGMDHSFVLELVTKEPRPYSGVGGIVGSGAAPEMGESAAVPDPVPRPPRPVLTPPPVQPVQQPWWKRRAVVGAALATGALGGWYWYTHRR